jgi:hypothetical protein
VRRVIRVTLISTNQKPSCQDTAVSETLPCVLSRVCRVSKLCRVFYLESTMYDTLPCVIFNSTVRLNFIVYFYEYTRQTLCLPCFIPHVHTVKLCPDGSSCFSSSDMFFTCVLVKFAWGGIWKMLDI